jgi:hypothetical protein
MLHDISSLGGIGEDTVEIWDEEDKADYPLKQTIHSHYCRLVFGISSVLINIFDCTIHILYKQCHKTHPLLLNFFTVLWLYG